jgi:subfamily B ATP-binding cassette protein MsbA
MFFLSPIRNGVVRDIRNRMLKKVLDLPLSYYSEEKKGDIMSRMTTDVLEIEWSIMQTLELIFREPLLIILSLITLISISPYLTLFVFLLLPVAGAIVAIIGKSLKRSATRGREILGSLFSVMEETLGGLKVIKAFTAEKFIQEKFKSVNEKFYETSVKIYRKTDLTSPVSETVVVGILMFILYIGGAMVLKNDGLSASAFIMYFAVASQIVPPIKQITLAYNNIQKGLASEERIEKILKAENTIVNAKDAITKTSFTSEIEFKNVCFAYTKGDQGYVLKNINLKIEKGKTIALVGQSGSGKTTLADMIPRYYDPSEGDILIDGISLKNISLESLRSLIGVVAQESVLFNDSIAHNIAFGSKGHTQNEIEDAAKVANAHEFISKTDLGYQSNVGDRGGKLSGGQKQRISIARAVLKNPPILILDEATSALDTESEKLVQDALNNLTKNRTTLVIAHRLSTIVNADEIIVLNKGEMIERGSHEELLRQKGTYAKLFEMQSFK